MNAKLNITGDIKTTAKQIVENQQRYFDDTSDLRQWIQEAIELDFESDPDAQKNALVALMTLDDEDFSLIAPAFLEEWEASLNDINNKLIMAKMSAIMGTTVTEVMTSYNALIEEINTLEALSPTKRSFLVQICTILENLTLQLSDVNDKTVIIPIELCHPDAKAPTYAHLTDAGMDVYALDDVTIAPGETKLIPTGIKVAIPDGYEIQVRPKSGRCLKTKLRIANTPGTIDSGYRDEIGIIIDNIEPYIKSAEMDENGKLYNVLFGSSYTIGKGEKFAQLVLKPVPKIAWVQVDHITAEGDRGGGFGSTGIK